jgi:hypothetical protein
MWVLAKRKSHPSVGGGFRFCRGASYVVKISSEDQREQDADLKSLGFKG